MAKMIDRKPEYYGETKFWEAAKSFLPDETVVYHNREIKGKQFDFCLLFENLGVLIVEVKGWKSNEIEVKSTDVINVSGFENPQHSPKKQARTYRFNLLNEIQRRLNASPVVLDMVCYPFLTRSDFFNLRLDIVSEEAYTIFSDDLDDGVKFNNKIKQLFQADGYLGKSKLDHALIRQIREFFEVDIEDDTKESKNIYSQLLICRNDLSDAEILNIIADYFLGIKTVLFLNSYSQIEAVCRKLNQAFIKHNLQPTRNNVALGYGTEIRVVADAVCTFNFEAYFVPGLSNLCDNNVVIIEGVASVKEQEILKKVAQKTSFNIDQYTIEHASIYNNTLVEAGAGTGKTYSMVSRIAYLCNRSKHAVTNISEEIAMVTFTNDAANNMKVRIKRMLTNYFLLTNRVKYLQLIEQVDSAQISTIHKFAIELLRKCSFFTGLGVNFKITENKHKRQLIYDQYIASFIEKQISKNKNFENEFPVEVYDFKKKIMEFADKLMNKSVSIRQIKPSEFGMPAEGNIPYFNDILLDIILPAETLYNQLIHEENGMDLKECIMLLDEILKKHDGVIFKSRIRFLFIDEFQDTDDIQIHLFLLIQKAIGIQCRVFIVGDLKQSIYRFRGANLSAFDLMKGNNPKSWNTFHLTKNYRTDYRLLEKFDEVFTFMGQMHYLPYGEEDRLIGAVSSTQPVEQLFVSIPCHGKDEKSYFDILIQTIQAQMSNIQQTMKEKTMSREERTIALLVRSNWQVAIIVEEAEKRDMRNIEIQTGGDLYQLDSTLDLCKLLLAMGNSRNPLYLSNFIESNYTPMKLNYARYHGLSDEEKCNDLTRILNEYCMRTMNKTWESLINSAYSQPILYVLKNIYDAFAPWKNYSLDHEAQLLYMTNYEYLLEKIIQSGRSDALTLNNVSEFLQINITTGQKALSRSINDDFGGVRIVCTTVHKSKGLEYGTVILPFTSADIADISRMKLDANYSQSKLSYAVEFDNGVREHNNYYNIMTEQNEQIGEESRILYVAMTRAIHNLIWFEDVDFQSDPSWGSILKGD